MVFASITFTFQQLLTYTDQRPAVEGQPLATMPYDIIVEIFELVGMCGAICLGLTCKQLYGFLKMRNPDPISLQQPSCPYWPRCETEKINRKKHVGCGVLPYLLKDWFGPRYRLSIERANEFDLIHLPVSFVATKVYGRVGTSRKNNNKTNPAEQRNFRRRQDYRRSAVRCNLKGDGNFVETERLLPNPFNMGNEWYAEALAAIRASIFRFDTVVGWEQFWGDYHVMNETKESFDDTIAEYLEAKRTGKFVLTKERRLWRRM
jgi:hypothetical protein